MNKSLILLTKSFPYDLGEDFLENEIEIISKAFSNIYIVATAVTGKGIITKRIPPNVKCFPVKECNKRDIRYIKYILNGLKNITDDDVKRELLEKDSIVQKMAVIYFAGRSRSILKSIKKNKELLVLLKEPTTILYSYWFADLAYLASIIKLEFSQIKTVSRAHGYDLYEERNPGKSIPFRRNVLKSINRVFPCSNDGAMYLENKYPEFASKIELSYLGTKDNGFSANGAHDVFHIITCSSIIPLKRVHLVAQAIKILEERGISVKWTCIGDGPLLQEIKRYVSENIKRSEVTFTGRISNAAVLEIYKQQAVDVFVNVSETEGLPVSIMEAISFGIPILATNVGGTNEIVKDSVTGILIDKDSTPEDIANQIKRIMDIPWNRDQIREFWNKKFNASENFKRFALEISRL